MHNHLADTVSSIMRGYGISIPVLVLLGFQIVAPSALFSLNMMRG